MNISLALWTSSPVYCSMPCHVKLFRTICGLRFSISWHRFECHLSTNHCIIWSEYKVHMQIYIAVLLVVSFFFLWQHNILLSFLMNRWKAASCIHLVKNYIWNVYSCAKSSWFRLINTNIEVVIDRNYGEERLVQATKC